MEEVHLHEMIASYLADLSCTLHWKDSHHFVLSQLWAKADFSIGYTIHNSDTTLHWEDTMVYKEFLMSEFGSKADFLIGYTIHNSDNTLHWEATMVYKEILWCHSYEGMQIS